MAKLSEPPDINVVRAFKGKLDFYSIRGNWYVRKWPEMQKTTVTPTNQNNINRFRYWQQGNKLLSGYIIDAWRAIARDTRWAWRDVGYRYYVGKTASALNSPNLGPSSNYPFPTQRNPLWFIYEAFYYVQPNRVTLIFWFDGLVPAVQLVAQENPPTGKTVYKERRGTVHDCGIDWGAEDNRTVNDLQVPAILADSDRRLCDVYQDMGLRSAQIEVWNSDTGYLGPFTEQQSYMIIRQEHQDLTKPGASDVFSAGFWFLWNQGDVSHAINAYPRRDPTDTPFWPIAPADNFFQTRQRPGPYETKPGSGKYPLVPYYKARDWIPVLVSGDSSADYCAAPCGIFDQNPNEDCEPDPRPKGLQVEMSWLYAEYTQTTHPGSTLRRGGFPDGFGTGGIAIGPGAGEIPCTFFGIGYPNPCALEVHCDPDRDNWGDCDNPPAPFDTAAIYQNLAVYARDVASYTDYVQVPGTAPALADFTAAIGPTDYAMTKQIFMWAAVDNTGMQPYECLAKRSWTFTQAVPFAEVELGHDQGHDFLGTGPDFYQLIGTQTYAADTGSVIVFFYIWNSYGYLELGGAGIPFNAAGIMESLDDDPILGLLGFTPT